MTDGEQEAALCLTGAYVPAGLYMPEKHKARPGCTRRGKQGRPLPVRVF